MEMLILIGDHIFLKSGYRTKEKGSAHSHTTNAIKNYNVMYQQ